MPSGLIVLFFGGLGISIGMAFFIITLLFKERSERQAARRIGAALIFIGALLVLIVDHYN